MREHITRIVVNRTVIRLNDKNDTDHPPISVRTSGGVVYCHEAVWPNNRLVYDRKHPLPCGAKLWLEITGVTVLPVIHGGRRGDAEKEAERTVPAAALRRA